MRVRSNGSWWEIVFRTESLAAVPIGNAIWPYLTPAAQAMRDSNRVVVVDSGSTQRLPNGSLTGFGMFAAVVGVVVLMYVGMQHSWMR